MDNDPNDSLVNGDGDTTDFSTQYGAQYVASQTPYDSVDNGTITQTGSGNTTTATYTPPSWLTGITGLLNAGAPVASTVGTAVSAFTNKPGSTSAANATKANTVGGALSGFSSYLPWIIGAAIVGFIGFLIFRHK